MKNFHWLFFICFILSCSKTNAQKNWWMELGAGAGIQHIWGVPYVNTQASLVFRNERIGFEFNFGKNNGSFGDHSYIGIKHALYGFRHVIIFTPHGIGVPFGNTNSASTGIILNFLNSRAMLGGGAYLVNGSSFQLKNFSKREGIYEYSNRTIDPILRYYYSLQFKRGNLNFSLKNTFDFEVAERSLSYRFYLFAQKDGERAIYKDLNFKYNFLKNVNIIAGSRLMVPLSKYNGNAKVIFMGFLGKMSEKFSLGLERDITSGSLSRDKGEDTVQTNVTNQDTTYSIYRSNLANNTRRTSVLFEFNTGIVFNEMLVKWGFASTIFTYKSKSRNGLPPELQEKLHDKFLTVGICPMLKLKSEFIDIGIRLDLPFSTLKPALGLSWNISL